MCLQGFPKRGSRNSNGRKAYLLRVENWPRQLSEILCTTPAQDGSMLLRGKIGLGRPLTYDLNLNAAKFPAQRLVEVLRGVKKGLPQDFSAGGTVNADLNFAADGFGPAEWSGSGKTDSLVLRSAALRPASTQASAGDALALGSVPFRAMWSAVRQSAKSKLALDANDIDFPLGNSVVVGPATVNLGPGTAKDDGANVDRGSFRAWFSPSAYCASFSGEGPIQRLLQMARAAGFTAVQPPLAGETKFEWHAAGSWSGFAPPVTKGSIQLRNVRAEFPGLNAPVEIAYGEVSLTPDLVKVDKLSATTGGIHWTGAVTRPRICPAPAACPTVVDLHADEISLEKLNSLLNPNIQKRPWYRILTGTGQVRSALRTLNVTGSLKADRLVVGDLGVIAGAAKIKLQDGYLRFSEFHGTLLGGKHIGEWHADFTKDTPEYAGTGALESAALPQLGKLMHSNWITGSTNATYDIHFAGWSGADLLGSVHGTITLDARDGSLARFGPGTNALAFHHLSSTLTAGKSLVVISSGKLENSQGIYEGSGVASFAHQLDLRFVRDGGHGFAITGTLENPHVEALSGEKPVVAKSEKTSERTR